MIFNPLKIFTNDRNYTVSQDTIDLATIPHVILTRVYSRSACIRLFHLFSTRYVWWSGGKDLEGSH